MVQEEKRAKLRKYRVEDATKADLNKLSESISQRLKQLAATKQP